MTINPNDISVWFYDDSDLAISPSDHVTGLRRELLLRRISQQFGEGIMSDAEPVFGLDHRCVWVERAGFEHGIALVYLRGSLTGDGTCHALNLAEALARITGDSTKALQAVLEADGVGDTLTAHTVSRDAIRRAELLATGWRWLRKLAAR